MLKDIVTLDGVDLGVQRTEAPRAGNVLSVQLGALEFSQTFGIDLRYFLESDFVIQTDSFKAYCVQRLLESRVNVVNVVTTVETFFARFSFGIGSSENSSGGLIA